MRDWRAGSKAITIENFEVYDNDEDMGKTTAHYITQLTKELERETSKKRFRVDIEVKVYVE